MRERFPNAISSSSVIASFPTSIWTPPSLMDYAPDPTDTNALYTATDETDDVTTYTDQDGLYLAELDFVVGMEPNLTYSGSPVIQVWSGSSLSGTQFDILLNDAAFGAASARECRVWVGSNRIDFNVAQIADSGFSTPYVTYKYSHSELTAALQARRDAEIVATQTFASGQSTLPTIGSLLPGYGYIDGTGYAGGAGIRQLTDTTDIAQMSAVVWILNARSHGEDCPYRTRGNVTSPVALPFGQDILVGRNYKPTWASDTGSNKLIAGSGDYVRFAGRRYSNTSTTLALNLETPIGTRL